MTYPEVRRAILLVAALYLLFRFVNAVLAILFLFFIVFILAMALNPVVNWLCARRVPRTVAAAGIGALFLGMLALAGALIVPAAIEQTAQFVRDAPRYWSEGLQRAEGLLGRVPFLRARIAQGGALGEQVLTYAGQLLKQAGRFGLSAAGVVFALFLVFTLTIYTLATPRPLVQGFLGALSEPVRERAKAALVRIAHQMRAWVAASLLLGLAVALVVWLGLTLLGVPNALLLAVLAFFGEFVPNFGPVVSAIPAVLIAFAVSPTMALWVILLYVIIQQLENQILVPLIMSGQLELHPVSVAFFVLVMGSLAGVMGALLAVPIAAVVKVLYEEFYFKPRHPDERAIRGDADAVLQA